MNSDYDIVVIGAGPAGMMAAKTAAQEGLKVLLVDAKEEIAKVRRSCCANLFNEPNTHGEFITVERDQIKFHVNDFTVRYTGGWIKLKKNMRISPGERCLTLQREIDPIAFSFDKEVLLEDLLEDTQKSGVEIKNNTLGIKIENVPEGVKVYLRSGGRDLEVTSRYAIAADGVNSRSVESLGLNKERKLFGGFGVISYIMEDVECPYADAWLSFIGRGHLNGGRGQLYFDPKPPKNPKGPLQFELTCGCPVDTSPKEAIDWFMKSGRFSSWFKRARIVETRTAILYFRTPVPGPVKGRVVIVGDAPAFIEVYVQGALMYGYQGAKAIIREIEGEEGFHEYIKSWKNTFEYNFPGEIEKATQSFGLHVLEDEELDYLFGLTENDQISGYLNEFTDPNRVMGGILRHMERIRKERPALVRKIEEFGKVSVKEALQVQ
jgi:flavin-dependent dehydrogenase